MRWFVLIVDRVRCEGKHHHKPYPCRNQTSSMEDSFRVRVDRAFGSLEAAAASSSSSIKAPSSSLSSLWCLTDEEIQRNEWILDKVTPYKDEDEELHRLKNPKPYSSFLQGLLATEPSTSNQDLESDIQELDDEDDNQPPQLSKPDDHSNEEWDIRSSVGMDCTLDNEEEEDAYDKVAVGREESAERFYMKAVNDYEVDVDSNIELPASLTDVLRDPRANHTAAKLRLKEDEESARKLGLQVSENNIQESCPMESKKKVRFELGENEGHEQGVTVKTVKDEVVPFLPRASVPDYLQNPSKYTRYTFDSMDDVDEESNKKAYMDMLSLLKGSSDMEIQGDVSTDSTKPIVFVPKKKSSGSSMKKSKVHDEEHNQKKVVPAGIAAEDIHEGEVCAMDEDEPEISANKKTSLQKRGRSYRTKGTAQME